MRRCHRCYRYLLIGLLGGLCFMTFLVSPALTQEMNAPEKLKEADNLCIKAVKKAAEAREICDCDPLQAALEWANKASVLISEVAAEAENTGSIELAQSAYDMAINIVGAAVALIIETCTYCAQTSLDLETVACCEENRAKAEEVARLNHETIQITLAAGAIPRLPEAYQEREAPPMSSRLWRMSRLFGTMNNLQPVL